jgi:hypothetical protein
MQDEIDAVLIAMNQFATYYQDEEVIQWGLVMGPFSEPLLDAWGNQQFSEIISNLAPFSNFISALSGVDADMLAGVEPIYDLIYLSLWNLAPTSSLPWPISDLSFMNSPLPTGIGSNILTKPDPQNFKINWREDSQRVVIVFTDEPGQSYIYMANNINDPTTIYNENISQLDLQQLISNCIDLNVYTFTKLAQKDTNWMGEKAGFEPLTIYGGQWFELVGNPAQLYENLMQIIDDNACE